MKYFVVFSLVMWIQAVAYSQEIDSEIIELNHFMIVDGTPALVKLKTSGIIEKVLVSVPAYFDANSTLKDHFNTVIGSEPAIHPRDLDVLRFVDFTGDEVHLNQACHTDLLIIAVSYLNLNTLSNIVITAPKNLLADLRVSHMIKTLELLGIPADNVAVKYRQPLGENSDNTIKIDIRPKSMVIVP